MHRFLITVTILTAGITTIQRPTHAQVVNTDFIKAEYKDTLAGTLRYSMMSPKTLPKGKRFPLIITLHGIGGRGKPNWELNCEANQELAKPNLRKKHPCFVLAPTVSQAQRWENEPLKALLKLIDKLSTELPIDTRRIYITGQSMGGSGTYNAITKQPKQFAAAAPVCGSAKPNSANRIASIPIWIFHGRLDQIVPVSNSQNMVKALKNAGGNPRYTEYPKMAHNSWSQTYQNPAFWEWLFSQQLPQ
ncbi:MAG: prolyl oligopeptidase family serine peptidase [Planctomycetota bacterium]|nr:prolyl oligopeptidase family serine peptidase [Planctomycetota bacterium]